MSLFLQPQPQNPTTFRSITDLHPSEVVDFFSRFETLVADSISSTPGGRLNEAGHTDEAFVEFSLPASSGDAASLAAAERKIAEQLSISRVPRQSGTRAVFVDLKNGSLFVGTTVLFNERNATTGVADDSLLHKVDLIQTLLGLNVHTSDDEEALPAEPNGLDTVTLRIGTDGPVVSLRQIGELVAKSRDPHSAFFAGIAFPR